MDEVLFRGSQRLENFQVQLNIAANQSKDLLQQYSQQSKSIILQAWNSSSSLKLKAHARELWEYFVELGAALKQQMWDRLDPQQLYYNLVKVFWKKWSKRDICFLSAGFICGGIVGVIVALSIKKKDKVIRYMQAIQCTNYLGVEAAAVVENARAPYLCSDNDVIISVKAASVHVIDAEICTGYGRTLRKILKRVYMKGKHLPVTLGRDCTGVVTDVGVNVKRVEVGDEVWLSVPFWCDGTLSQSVRVPEFRVSRKPKNVGYEGACSLPYAGSLALHALKRAETTKDNAENKKFLIVGGCTPVGCVLIQILKHWKAEVTATCTKRATPVAKALGASEIIVFPEMPQTEGQHVVTLEVPQDCLNAFEKELELRDKFDCVIVTKSCVLATRALADFCSGRVVSTVPQPRSSDSCGVLGELVLGAYIYINSICEKLLGTSSIDFDEGHFCYMTLDELAELVENGVLQTVVDKVFHPQDIEIALNHIQSYDSIGSTVITFR